jgi:hypothetical protein
MYKEVIKMKVNPLYFLIKSGVLLAVFLSPLSCYYSIPLCLFLTWSYQYLIAFLYPGVHAMPSMDACCHLDTDAARVNFLSVTTVERYNFESARKRALKYL